ncbi:MAG: hypothetical protein NTX53_18765 [candidate division WOR-3 bacterium]|nr:hypothetical protein [candidate division WOR-3 bacterium]
MTIRAVLLCCVLAAIPLFTAGCLAPTTVTMVPDMGNVPVVNSNKSIVVDSVSGGQESNYGMYGYTGPRISNADFKLALIGTLSKTGYPDIAPGGARLPTRREHP